MQKAWGEVYYERILQKVVGIQYQTEFLASRSTSRRTSPFWKICMGNLGSGQPEFIWSRCPEVSPNTKGTVWTLKRYQMERNPHPERVQTGPKAFPATWKSPRVSSKEQKITKDVAVERFFFLMIRGHQKK